MYVLCVSGEDAVFTLFVLFFNGGLCLSINLYSFIHAQRKTRSS